jgi:hypothetical protein
VAAPLIGRTRITSMHEGNTFGKTPFGVFQEAQLKQTGNIVCNI